MTLRRYGALSYSQNSARDLRCSLNGALSAFFAKGCVYIINSKQRKHQTSQERVVSTNTNELKTRLGCNKQVQMG